MQHICSRVNPVGYGTLYAMSHRYDIGFLGGGQLARMSIQAAQRAGLRCLSLDSGADTPAAQIAPSLVGELNDVEKIAEVLRRCDRVTLENEFIRAEHIREACRLAHVDEAIIIPGIDSLYTIQDKLRQRTALIEAGVPSPKAVELTGDGEAAIEQIGFPMVLKVRFGGYDGKGTRYAKTYGDLIALKPIWSSGEWLAEQFVPFTRELAVIVYVDERGAGCFPTMETIQTDHVCDLVFPSGVDASEVAIAAIRAINGRGLYGVELFELHDGGFQINEIAPRPHNTGHYTLDWGGVSQFEQHIRLVMNWNTVLPEGRPTCMANILGRVPTGYYAGAIGAALDVPGVFFHWYGKTSVKPGRKMGHLNAVGEHCVERAVQAREQFFRAWTIPVT